MTQKKEKSLESDDAKSIAEDISGDGGVMKTIVKRGVETTFPDDGDEVNITYIGKLANGDVFDRDHESEEVIFLLGKKQLKDIIPVGLEMAIKKMVKGEEAIVRIEPAYGYGEEGLVDLPGNATLIYDIKLHDWSSLVDISEKDDGGILKKMLNKGDGKNYPNLDIRVKVNFSAFMEYNAAPFLEKRGFEFTTDEEEEDITVLPSMIRAVLTMQEGERSSFKVKPEYAYGYQGNSKYYIPANATLTYDIELLEFEHEDEYWKLDIENKLKISEQKKQEGNDLYNRQKYFRAIRKYKLVLDFWKYEMPSISDEDKESIKKYKITCHLNTAACYIKLEEYKEVLTQCNCVLELDENNVKALYRRGRAYVALGEYQEADHDFTDARQLDPENFEVLGELLKVKRIISEQLQHEKQMFSGMFERGEIYTDVAGPAEKGFFDRFIDSIFIPGIAREHVTFMNIVFVGLFGFLMMYILSYGNSKHFYSLLVIAILLFFGIQWFIVYVTDEDEKNKDKVE